MKIYPLVIFELADSNEEPIGYYSKGHHDDVLFRAAVVAEVIEQTDAEDTELMQKVSCATIQRTWWRSIHIEQQHGDAIKFIERSAHDPFAYPVTVIRVEI